MKPIAPHDLQRFKARVDRHRISKALENRDVKDLVLWFSYLLDEADPTRGQSWDQTGRSAETPLPHTGTASARRALERAVEDVQRLTVRIQVALSVPAEQRTMIATTRRSGVSVSTSNGTGKATEMQQNRIAELAGEVYGSVVEMEKQIGVRTVSLNSSAAVRLIRTLKG